MASRAHQLLCQAVPDMIEKLRMDDPERLGMMEEGWSWIEMVGGPRDGTWYYYVGCPQWEVHHVDSAVTDDPLQKHTTPAIVAATKPELLHRYLLECGDEGQALYRYQGTMTPKVK